MKIYEPLVVVIGVVGLSMGYDICPWDMTCLWRSMTTLEHVISHGYAKRHRTCASCQIIDMHLVMLIGYTRLYQFGWQLTSWFLGLHSFESELACHGAYKHFSRNQTEWRSLFRVTVSPTSRAYRGTAAPQQKKVRNWLSNPWEGRVCVNIISNLRQQIHQAIWDNLSITGLTHRFSSSGPIPSINASIWFNKE